MFDFFSLEIQAVNFSRSAKTCYVQLYKFPSGLMISEIKSDSENMCKLWCK